MSITFDTGQYTASATAGAIVSSNAQRTSLLITQVGTTPVYIGNSSVSTTSGHYLPGVTGASVSIPTRDAVYVVTASSTSALTYVETYL